MKILKSMSTIKAAPVKEVPSVVKNLVVPESKAMEPSQKIIVSRGVPVTSRYQQTRNLVQSNTKLFIIQKEQDLRIRDVFENEVLEIGSQLCIQMSTDRRHSMAEALDAFDRFENLIEKSANDVCALNNMIDLIDRINFQSPGFIHTNDKRNERLLKEAKEKQKLKKYDENN